MNQVFMDCPPLGLIPPQPVKRPGIPNERVALPDLLTGSSPAGHLVVELLGRGPQQLVRLQEQVVRGPADPPIRQQLDRQVRVAERELPASASPYAAAAPSYQF
jgi:hypothetical protein